jgi:hypothetical protein
VNRTKVFEADYQDYVTLSQRYGIAPKTYEEYLEMRLKLAGEKPWITESAVYGNDCPKGSCDV